MASIPVISRVSPRIIRILGCNPGKMTLQGTNTYLIGNGQRRILLDTGDEDVPQYIQSLKQVLKEENALLQHVLISHWHHDHIGGLKNLFENDSEEVDYCKVWKYPSSGNESYPSYKVTYEYLTNKQEFSVDGATIQVIHTPGHTTDHIVLYLKEESAIFSGDCILGEGTAVFEDLFDYIKSLQLILEYRPKIIYPGHGNIVKDPKEKIEYYIDHRNQREKQIIDVLQKDPHNFYSEMDLVKMIYKDTPENLHAAAAYNVNHHLVKLLKEKRVSKNNDLWQAKL